MKKRLIGIAIVIIQIVLPISNAHAAVKPGSTCPKVGATAKLNGYTYTCIKLGSKLYWNNGKKEVSKAPGTSVTVAQGNAIKMAKNYLGYSAFSRSGLIKQLVFEGFSESDAIVGVDAQKANWNEQAAKMAKNYLSYSSFSRSGLIHQLEFEGFSTAQAEFGANAVGL